MNLELNTERLRLRPLTEADAPQVRLLAGDHAISSTALYIPYPFPEGAAEEFIAGTIEARLAGVGYTFAIEERAVPGRLVGCMGLPLQVDDRKAELGYWIGRPWWGLGYATEAGRAMLRFGFETLGLHRIHANHIGGNEASGRVLQKLGFQYEGTHRDDAFHQGRYVDLVCYGLLEHEFQA
jgi:RimJ/RimL family protein N-acetyltransferase